MAHMRGVRLFVSVAIASALASGCKDDDEGLSADEAPETLAERVCSAYYECGCEARIPDRFTSQEDCELEIASEIQSDIDEGEEADLTYRPECADDIAEVFDAIGCDSLSEIIVDTDLLAELDRLETCKLFHGTRTAGQPCEPLESGNGDDCEADLLCEPPNIGGEPVCRVARRTKVEGEDCVEG